MSCLDYFAFLVRWLVIYRMDSTFRDKILKVIHSTSGWSFLILAYCFYKMQLVKWTVA